MNLEDTLKRCILEIAQDDSYNIDEATNLTTDLNFNSIDFVKLIVKLEFVFDIEFDDEYLDFQKFNTYSWLYNYLLERIEEL